MTVSQQPPFAELRDFVDLNFARRLESAETLTADHVSALQRFTPEATAEVIAGGTAVFGGKAYPANHIVGMGLYGAVTSEDIGRVEEFYRSRGAACEIVVSPLADRSLRESLCSRGYCVTEFNSVLIRRLEQGPLMDPADGVTIKPVTTASVQLWDSVVAAGFSEFGPLPENTFAPFATVPQSLNFLARVDGVPAVNRLHHAPSWNCGTVWLCYHSGTSRPWRADRTNQPPFVGGRTSGCGIRGGQYASWKRLAA